MIEELIKFRRELHQYPEISHQQIETTKRIKNMAIRLGVKQEWITLLPKTGLWIDIRGEAAPHQKNFCLGLRADIDALNMTQNNDSLPYKSVNQGAAHMCGHDGHTTCLLALIPLFLAQISQIPSNKSVRLLFQPAEQKHNGAIIMISHGCLEGVDQIYGFHNANISLLGEVWCKEGPIMSVITHVIIKIYGDRGQSHYQEVNHFALDRAVAFYKNIVNFIEQLCKKQGSNFTCTLPLFQSGNSYNICSEQVRIQGTIRSYSEQATNVLINKITEQLRIIQLQGFTTSFQECHGCLLINQHKSTEHILRLAKLQFGEQKVGPGLLPIKASEDFGQYLKTVPGAYFFMGGRDEQHIGVPHCSNYNFNDKLIDIVSKFWMKLVRDRFQMGA